MQAVHDFPEKSGSASNRTARVLADRAAGEAYVASVCFKHGPPRLTGVELEFTVHHADDPARPLDPDVLATALGPHSSLTAVTIEGRFFAIRNLSPVAESLITSPVRPYRCGLSRPTST